MIVRLLNVGDTTFTNKYGGTKYRIEPGKELYVDVAAAILWMGDPDVRNIDARNRNRADELTRLCVKYGCIGSPLQLRELGPQLEWYLQDGTRVTTIAEDPFGEKTLGTQLTESGAPSTDADSGSTAQKQISKLVDLLREQGIDISTDDLHEPVEITDDGEIVGSDPEPPPASEMKDKGTPVNPQTTRAAAAKVKVPNLNPPDGPPQPQ